MKAFDDDIIPDTETLSLTYLPDRVHWQARSWVSLKGPGDLNCLERNSERRSRETLGG